MKNLAIVVTHPIQYYVPVFQLLAQQCNVKVFYTWGQAGMAEKFDPDFGKAINWDLPLLQGYHYEALENTAKQPGSHHAKGIINPEIIERINEFKPDAILIYGWLYHSHRKVMKHFKGKVPIWFRGDSTLLDNKPGLKNSLKKIYLTHIYKYIDKAFYVGTNNKAYFKNYGLKEQQLIFAPHAVDNQRFAEDRVLERSMLRENLGVDKKDILILFAGKLEPKKNPELLLDAFINLNQIITNNEKQAIDNNSKKTHLLFVGNGILEKELKLKSQVSNLKSQIHFMNFQNQTKMPSIYQACDIFCLPSRGPGETWGLAINEAMATGKAILASNKVGCAIDLVRDNENGFIFSDEKDCLNKLKACLNPKVLTKFAANAQLFINDWSFENQVTAFLNALNEQR